MEKITLLQIRDLGQTIGDPFLFFRANFKLLFKAFLYYAVPLLAIEVILLLFGHKTSSPFYTGYGSSAALRGFGAKAVLGYLFSLIVSLTQQFYVIELLLLKSDHEDVTNAEVLGKMKEDWGIFIATFLSLIPLFMVFVIFMAIIVGLASLLGNILLVPAIIGIFVIAGYGLVALSNLFFIRLREKISIGDSMSKCFKLMAGSWWKTVTAWFVSASIFYAISFSIIAFFGVFVFIFNFHNLSSGLDSTTTRVAIITAITGVTTTLGTFVFHFMANIITVFTGINYFSLSEKYDNYHLKAEINQLGQIQDNNTHRQEGEY